MNQQIKNQKSLLEDALRCLNTIEWCDEKIQETQEANLIPCSNLSPHYYVGVKADAVDQYAETLKKIIQQSIDISAEFEARKISNEIFNELNIITHEYARNNNINL